MKTYFDKINLITSQQQLQEVKEEDELNDFPYAQQTIIEKFNLLRSSVEEQQLNELSQIERIPCQVQNHQKQLIKKLKKEQLKSIPYKSHDNKRRAISLEFQLQEGRKYFDEFLCQEFVTGKKQQKETQQLLNQFFEFQIKIHPYIFNKQVSILQQQLAQSLRLFDEIIAIHNQEQDTRITSFNHLIEFNPIKESLLVFLSLFHQSEEFQKRFSNQLINEICYQFCKRLQTNKFLPYNLPLSVNTIRMLNQAAFKQINSYLPKYWTLQFEWRLGMQQLIFNPLKLQEVANYIIQFEPSYVQLLNLHENDPKRFRSLKNLGIKSIESSLYSMMISDIGRAFNYDTKDIKKFCDATLLNTKITNQQTIIQYLSSFFMPISILSGVPLLKIGKIYASSGERIKKKLFKSIKRSEFEKTFDINDYFEASTILNHPEQRIVANIRSGVQIIMDFVLRKFIIIQQKLEEINEIKDIILYNIQFM